MKYLMIERLSNSMGVGYRIKDSVTDISVSYYGYSMSEAIKKHREKMNIKGKHFERIMI